MRGLFYAPSYAERYDKMFNTDINVNLQNTIPGNVAVTPATFAPRAIAQEIMSVAKFCNHNGQLHIYKYAAQQCCGRYFPVSGTEEYNVEMNIAQNYIETLSSLKDVRTPVAKIMDFVRVLAPAIEEDQSQNDNLIIFADGSYIDKNEANPQLHQFGSDKFFSSALMITGNQFMSVPCTPPSCIVDLAKIQGGQDGQRWLNSILEVLGYLIADEPTKKIVCLQGLPDTFKSTVFNAITSILPPEYVYTQTLDDLGDRFGLDSIGNAKILSISDAESGNIRPKSVACLKRISGNDAVRVNIKHKSGFSARVKAAIIVVTNHSLPFNDAAAESRCICIPFPVSVAEPATAASLATRFQNESIQLYKAALVAHMNRKIQGRPLMGYAPLNSCTVDATAITWHNLMWNYIRLGIVQDQTRNISKRQLFDSFCYICSVIGLAEKPDYDDFCRVFNQTFTAMYPTQTQRLTSVRVQGAPGTVQGLKNCAVCVENVLNVFSRRW